MTVAETLGIFVFLSERHEKDLALRAYSGLCQPEPLHFRQLAVNDPVPLHFRQDAVKRPEPPHCRHASDIAARKVPVPLQRRHGELNFLPVPSHVKQGCA